MCVLLRLWQDKRVNVGTCDSQGHNLPHSGNCGGGVKGVVSLLAPIFA